MKGQKLALFITEYRPNNLFIINKAKSGEILDYYDIISRLVEGKAPTADEAEAILACDDKNINQYLFTQADWIRSKISGQIVHIFGIIIMSNTCKGNCSFCRMNAQNKQIERFRMEPDDIITSVQEAAEAGYKSIVLHSCNDDYFTGEKLGDIIKEIKKSVSVSLILSVGERSYEEYSYWKQCGADRLFMRHNTSDVWLYQKYGSQATLSNRLICQRMAKNIGYKVDGGFLVGIPSQKPGSIWDDICLLKNMEAKVVNIEAFKGNDDENAEQNIILAKKSVALTRLFLRDVILGAPFPINLKTGRLGALDCGANAVCQYIDNKKYYSYIKEQQNLKDELQTPMEKREQIVKELSVMKRFAY